MAALLDRVLEAHGGRERWARATRIAARVRSGGLLVRTRFPGHGRAEYRIEVEVGRPRATAVPFPRPGRRAVFERGRVRIETDGGEVVESRADPRSRFFGRAGLRRNLRWDPLDATYFAGYALWNYLNTPWLLAGAGVQTREIEPWEAGGRRWRRLAARFPAGLDTHSPEQVFYFDDDGLLRRHDYVAEVVGGWARAAHMCDRHVEAGGLTFPARRRVHPRGHGDRALPGPTLVSLALSEFEVR
jgi:hypothetical protein